MKHAFFLAPRRWPCAFFAAALALLLGCAGAAKLPEGWPETLAQLLPADVILFGELHDVPAHQAMERSAVEWLSGQGKLSALVVEMAEAGQSTALLSANADEAAVRAALAWDERLWPWQHYAGAVMAAVRAGVPVLGGNLPRAAMPAVMRDAALDGALQPSARSAQLQAVRDGHCGLLPEAQLPGMVRIQIARDQSMARSVASAPRGPGQTVLLIAGGGHVLRSRGVPIHLPKNLTSKVVLTQVEQAQEAMKKEADLTPVTASNPQRDDCASLRARP